MSETHIQLPPDSTGKKLRAFTHDISGVTIYEEVMRVVDRSGEVVDFKSIRISGEVVQISGQSVIIQSGIAIAATVAQPTACYHVTQRIPEVSGGVTFNSHAVMTITIRNWPGNGNMWVGADGVSSGNGYLVAAGEEKLVRVDNANKVYMYMENSGELAMCIAEYL